MLEELAADVGPDRAHSDRLLDRLSSVNSFLREVLMLVNDVRGYTKQRTAEAQLTELLDKFSDSIEAARTAIGDFEYVLVRELQIQAVEKERAQYRPHELALKDRHTLVAQSRATVKSLKDLSKHLEGLLNWLLTVH